MVPKDLICARVSCRKPFTQKPRQVGQKFCCTNCQRREWVRMKAVILRSENKMNRAVVKELKAHAPLTLARIIRAIEEDRKHAVGS